MDEYNEDVRQQAEVWLEEQLIELELAQLQALNQSQEEYYEFI